MVDMLAKVEDRARFVLRHGERAAGKILKTSERASSSKKNKKSKSGLGSLIGKLGNCVANGAGTIARSAVPITHNILNTSASFVN